MTEDTTYNFNEIKAFDAYLEEYHYNIEGLRNCFGTRNWEGYSQVANRIKQSSKAVGAYSLYNEAVLMEMAAGFEYKPYIMNHHEKLLRDYTTVKEIIKKRILCQPKYIA